VAVVFRGDRGSQQHTERLTHSHHGKWRSPSGATEDRNFGMDSTPVKHWKVAITLRGDR
jgi:hypothetical protein